MYDLDFCCRQLPHLASCPYASELETQYCPICGEEAEDFYYNTKTREVIGCDHCVSIKEAWLAGTA